MALLSLLSKSIGIGKTVFKAVGITGKSAIQEAALSKGTGLVATEVPIGAAIPSKLVGVAKTIAKPVISTVGTILKVAIPAATKTFAAHPIKALAIGTVATGVIAGGGLVLVPKVFQATKKTTQAAIPILMGEKPLTSESVRDVAKLIGIGLGVTAVGVAAGVIAEKVIEKKGEDVEVVKGLVKETGKESVMSTDEGTPLTTETTTIGAKRYRRKKISQVQAQRISQRVNVIVSQRQHSNKIQRFINERQLVYA